MEKLNLNKSNNEIIELIKNKKPFSIVRLGIGAESYGTWCWIKSNRTSLGDIKFYVGELIVNTGIYLGTAEESINNLKLFCECYNNSIKTSDLLACHYSSPTSPEQMRLVESYFINKYNLKKISSNSIEPFYQLSQNIKPWTHYLLDKKILIIHPFVESFKKQEKNLKCLKIKIYFVKIKK